MAGYGFPVHLQGKRAGDLPFFKVGDISEAWKRKEARLVLAQHFLTHDEAASIRAKPLPANTTVFAKIGAAIALNRRAILSAPSLVDNNVMGLAPDTAVLLPEYLFHYTCTLHLDEISQATAVPSVRGSDIARLGIPIPPIAEQGRIVAEIEKHFTRLDAAVAALERSRAKLKRYRAAVLKAACEGRLVPTEAELARAEGREYEPADVLLTRILKERREGSKAKSEELDGPDKGSLPTLPEGWAWATTGQIGAIQGGIQKQPKRAPQKNAFPFLRVGNVLRGRLDLREIHKIELFGDELRRLRLEPGDLLVIEGNGSPTEIGRMAIWSGAIGDCVHQNHIIRIRPADGVLSVYVESFWNSPDGTGAVMRVASSTSGLYTLSVAKVSRLSVPLPPTAEQCRIVVEVERRLSVVDEMESQLDANLKRAERLRQALLKRAFEGKLVPQDSSDEPASVLLERIQAERANTARAITHRRVKQKITRREVAATLRLFD
jgi:type I restriction enzyme S subunit